MLKSIVTVQCIDVDVYVQSIVVVGRFIELIDHWSFSVNCLIDSGRPINLLHRSLVIFSDLIN